jgi:2-dehydropantoate 2-reductase
VGLSAATATIRLPIGPIRKNPRTRRFLLDIMREVVAVGRAQGAALSAEYAEGQFAFCDGLPAEFTSSMYHDLERGNRLEVDWLSGAVVVTGEQFRTKVGYRVPATSRHAPGRFEIRSIKFCDPLSTHS